MIKKLEVQIAKADQETLKLQDMQREGARQQTLSSLFL